MKEIIRCLLEDRQGTLDLEFNEPEGYRNSVHYSIGYRRGTGWFSYFKGRFKVHPVVDKFIQWFLAKNPKARTARVDSLPQIWWYDSSFVSLSFHGSRKTLRYDIRKRKWVSVHKRIIRPSYNWGFFTDSVFYYLDTDTEKHSSWGTVKLIPEEDLNRMIDEEFRIYGWEKL